MQTVIPSYIYSIMVQLSVSKVQFGPVFPPFGETGNWTDGSVQHIAQTWTRTVTNGSDRFDSHLNQVQMHNHWTSGFWPRKSGAHIYWHGMHHHEVDCEGGAQSTHLWAMHTSPSHWNTREVWVVMALGHQHLPPVSEYEREMERWWLPPSCIHMSFTSPSPLFHPILSVITSHVWVWGR